jgi:hypothetical protein
MIRCRILNFKNFNFISTAKKYNICRFAPCPVCVLDKFPHGERFFSPYSKNLSPCGKFNDINAKNKQKSAILPVLEPGKDRLFTRGEIFTVRGEKSLAVWELVQDT